MKRRSLRTGLHLAALLSLFPVPAWADVTKDQCIDANGKAQDLRRDGKLSAAREQLRTCGNPSCPAMVRDDCTKRLDELEKAQPTIAFEVKDASGADVSAVRITVDGRPFAEKLDGTALPVDIGEHTFAFEVAGKTPLTRTLVLTEGEKGRRERIVFGATAPATAAAPAPAAPPVALQRPSGQIVVTASKEATVTIDGQVVGQGRFDGRLPAGVHAIRVTEPAKIPYKADVDLRDGETRTVEVTLEGEHGNAIWPWIVGGAAVAVGAAIGGYFLFKPSDTVTPIPPGKTAAVTFMWWRP